MSDGKAEAWAAILEPDELRSVVRAVAIFERVGVLSGEDAREWRRAILDRHGMPVGEGEA